MIPYWNQAEKVQDSQNYKVLHLKIKHSALLNKKIMGVQKEDHFKWIKMRLYQAWLTKDKLILFFKIVYYMLKLIITR